MTTRIRLPLLLLAILSLLTGLASGLSRMGWDLNLLQTSLHHGSIMVGGFLGTIVALEKVIPLKKKSLLLIPMLSGSSVAFFFANQPRAAFTALVLASCLLSLVFLYYLTKVKNIVYLIMLGGSACWLVGNILLASREFYPAAFPWWMGFILAIITAERLELTKFLPVGRRQKLFLACCLIAYPAGVLLSFHSGGQWISGIALVAIALWLMKYDIVGVSIKRSGPQKFVAIALLCGYTAMLLTGVFMITLMNHTFGYDAVLHTFFLGFVFSMIFAHGPMILPGVIGLTAKPWHGIMYLWLILLHGSWMARVIADLSWDSEMRKMTGLITTLAIAGFFATVGTLLFKSTRTHEKIF